MIYSHSCSQTKRLIKLYLSNEVIRSILLIKTCSPPNRSIEGLEKYFYSHKIFSQENVTSWKNLGGGNRWFPVSSSNELPTVDERLTGRWRGASLEGISWFRFLGSPYILVCVRFPHSVLWSGRTNGKDPRSPCSIWELWWHGPWPYRYMQSKALD